MQEVCVKLTVIVEFSLGNDPLQSNCCIASCSDSSYLIGIPVACVKCVREWKGVCVREKERQGWIPCSVSLSFILHTSQPADFPSSPFSLPVPPAVALYLAQPPSSLLLILKLQVLCPCILILRHLPIGKHVLRSHRDSAYNFSALIPSSPSVTVHRCPEANFLSSRAAGSGLHVGRQLGCCAQQTASPRLYSQCEYHK